MIKRTHIFSLVISTSLTVFLGCKENTSPSEKFRGGGLSLDSSQSGVWSGFWIQNGQRGVMDLDIQISNNRIGGKGTDEVGPFELNGSYNDQGNVEINKQYLNAHRVIYTGLYQDNVIRGQWRIYNDIQGVSFDSGSFEIAWNAN